MSQKVCLVVTQLISLATFNVSMQLVKKLKPSLDIKRATRTWHTCACRFIPCSQHTLDIAMVKALKPGYQGGAYSSHMVKALKPGYQEGAYSSHMVKALKPG